MENQTPAQSEADFTYKLNAAGTGVVITGYKGTAAQVTIPATIEGFPVREIGPYAFSVEDNGKGMSTLYKEIPGNCKDTGVYTITYYDCSYDSQPKYEAEKVSYKLTSVVIPRGVTYIGTKAFAETFYKKSEKDTLEISHSLTSVTIPDTVTEIGGGAFEGCEKLDTVNLPPSLTKLGEFDYGKGVGGVFSGCKSLKTVVIPGGVKSIPREMFYECTALASVTLPKKLDSIGEYAFHGCASLSSLVIPDSVKAIGRDAFSLSGLTSFSWPAKLPVIPDRAFSSTNLKTLVIPKEIKEIGEDAFLGCKELTSLTFQTGFLSGIDTIHREAFRNCTALSAVTIPKTVKFPDRGLLHNDAFSGCSKLNLATQLEIKKRGYTGSF